MKLGALGEEELLRKLAPHLSPKKSIVSAPGDDCAVIQIPDRRNLLVLKTDCVVEGIHFARNASALAVGWKAMARPLSDFAAVSGLPQFALITLLAPTETAVRWVTDLYRGLEKAARRFSVAIVGGETSRTTGPIAISVSLAGEVESNRWTSRHGGKIGDELFVTGKLGGSIRGQHLRFTPRIAESRWLTRNFQLHAMMDLSDGLGSDLPRLARASGIGFEIDQASLPRNRGCSVKAAISDGEDYELLFAISPRESSNLQRRWKKKFPQLPLTRIGGLIRESKIDNRKLPTGYVHFQ